MRASGKYIGGIEEERERERKKRKTKKRTVKRGKEKKRAGGVVEVGSMVLVDPRINIQLLYPLEVTQIVFPPPFYV